MRSLCTFLFSLLCFFLGSCALFPITPSRNDRPSQIISLNEEITQAPLNLRDPLEKVGENLNQALSAITEEDFNPQLEDLPDAEYPEEPEEEGYEEEVPQKGEPFPQGISIPSPALAHGILGEKEFEGLLREEHPYIDRWIEFFTQTAKGREFFSRSLERMSLYGPHIARWLKENQLPPKLVWLAFIESGLNPNALSRARAKGIWQFIRGTARRYGLKRNTYLDERSDPYLSTLAASRYLRDLYLNYGSWELALAAYNAGERRIDRAWRKAGHNDYWQMLHHPRRILPRETKHYVPKLIAAYRIGIQLERYGFVTTSASTPLTWEVVVVPGGISLSELAKKTGIPEDLLSLLNPALRRRMTPPGDPYLLKVPPDRKEEVREIASTLPVLTSPPPLPDEGYTVYRVKKGDTLWKISRRFGIPMSALKDENDLKSSRLRLGQKLFLPRSSAKTMVKAKQSTTYTNTGAEVRYRIQPGDTLWGISRKFGIPLEYLIQYNRINPRKPLRSGHLIRIPPFPES